MNSQFPPSFIILAGGRGERMQSALPKPLHVIDSKTMLERVVEQAKGGGFKDIVVVYSDDRVKTLAAELGCRTAFQKEPLGTADALEKGLEKCSRSERIIVGCADVPLVPSSVYRQLSDRHLDEENYLTLLAARIENPSGYGRVVEKNGMVEKIVEEAEAASDQKRINLINGGVYCIRKRGLKEYLGRIQKSPVKGEYYLTDLVEIVKGSGERTGILECDASYITGINTQQHLREAEKKLKE